MARTGDNWSKKELALAVEAYVHMYRMQLSGNTPKKSQVQNIYLPQMAKKRSPKSWDYRMCNISAVFDDLGLEYVRGFKPLKNVGTRVRQELIEALVRSLA